MIVWMTISGLLMLIREDHLCLYVCVCVFGGNEADDDCMDDDGFSAHVKK